MITIYKKISCHHSPSQFQSQYTTTWQVPSVSLSREPRTLPRAGVQVLSYFKPVLLGMVHWYVHNLIFSPPPTNKWAGLSLWVSHYHCVSLPEDSYKRQVGLLVNAFTAFTVNWYFPLFRWHEGLNSRRRSFFLDRIFRCTLWSWRNFLNHINHLAFSEQQEVQVVDNNDHCMFREGRDWACYMPSDLNFSGHHVFCSLWLRAG